MAANGIQKRREGWYWLLSSMVFGLSCGAGYYSMAHRYSGRSTAVTIRHSLRDALRQIHSKLSKTPWWVFLTCPHHARFLWYPVVLYCLFQNQEEEEDDEKETLQRDYSMRLQEEEEESDESSPQNDRYLEMLVHNVSHTDLVLSVDTSSNKTNAEKDDTDKAEQDNDTKTTDNDGFCLCRPRFSAFDLYSKRLLVGLSQEEEIISFPRHERSSHTPRYTIVTPSPSRQAMLPTGFCLSKKQVVPKDELVNLRFRGRDVPRMAELQDNVVFNCVFFPLLATLLPRWHQRMSQKYCGNENVKKVLILVTGVGTPRNWTHSISGNSTQACAQLMERFINALYPDVTVVRIHSETNIFRYDENINFAKRELMPCIDTYRDAHARGLPYPDESSSPSQQATNNPFDTDWKKSFAVTISFADGSPARTHAIQASLRHYRPTYFHFWQLKTFWHDTKICDDDIEVHSFEDMEGEPAMETSLVRDDSLKLVVKEMCAFREEFTKTLAKESTDVFKFWLRKTKKPVLAVLLVRDPQKGPILYRGTNMEVSMPTGSLCAERNVIGTALANNPALKREDLVMVAVLAVPFVPHSMGRRTTSAASIASNVEEENDKKSTSQKDQDDDDWILQAPPPGDNSNKDSDAAEAQAANTKTVVTVPRSPRFSPALGASVPPAFDMESMALPPSKSAKESCSPPGTPRRLISLHNSIRYVDRKQKRTVVVNSSEDKNPLKPCGACNEWLKKIAESNPYFKVVTFTDADCTGVYVCPCQD